MSLTRVSSVVLQAYIANFSIQEHVHNFPVTMGHRVMQCRVSLQGERDRLNEKSLSYIGVLQVDDAFE